MRARLAHLLDWAALLLLLVTLVIRANDGLAFHLGALRVSASSPDRAFLLTLLVLTIRLVIGGRTPLPAEFRRFWRTLYKPTADVLAPAPPVNRWSRRGLAVLGFMAFGAVLLHTQLQHMHAVHDRGDPLFSVWRLGWVYHQLLGDPRGLFDANIFYPAPLALTFSDSMLLPAMINAPLIAAGVHPVTAYNVLLLGSFIASAFACYLLVEHLTASSRAAFIAGLLYGFHPFHYEHYLHLELLMAWWMPLSLLALHRFVETTRVKYAVWAALFSVAQLYSSMYLAVFYVWAAAALFTVLWVLGRPSARRMVVGGAIAAAVALPMALPLAKVYQSARLPDRPYQEVASFSADLSDYLRAHGHSAFWAHRTLGNPKSERSLFPGAALPVLAASALVPPVGMYRAAYAAAMMLSVEITRGSKGVLYPRLYKWLPFMRGLRVPARASLIVGLAMAVLAGFGARSLFQALPRAWAGPALAVLTVGVGVDLYPTFVLEEVWPAPPPIYQTLAGRTDVVLAEFPLGLSPGAWLVDAPVMYFSWWHWLPMVNGYSGHAPADQDAFLIAMRDFPASPTLDLLRGRGVTHVTVNCALYVEGCDELLRRIDAVPDLRLMAAVRWERRPVRLYELRR